MHDDGGEDDVVQCWVVLVLFESGMLVLVLSRRRYIGVCVSSSSDEEEDEPESEHNNVYFAMALGLACSTDVLACLC